jgi:hypothetical protein
LGCRHVRGRHFAHWRRVAAQLAVDGSRLASRDPLECYSRLRFPSYIFDASAESAAQVARVRNCRWEQNKYCCLPFWTPATLTRLRAATTVWSSPPSTRGARPNRPTRLNRRFSATPSARQLGLEHEMGKGGLAKAFRQVTKGLMDEQEGSHSQWLRPSADI